MQPFRRPLALVLAALFVALFATGCSQVPSNTPKACDGEDDTNCGYTATSEGSSEPVTQINFMNACVEAQTDADVSKDAADDLCGCIYGRIVEEIPFEDFSDFDAQLEEDPTDVPKAYEEFAEQCASGEGGGEGEGGG
jgi:hypothetical protein